MDEGDRGNKLNLALHTHTHTYSLTPTHLHMHTDTHPAQNDAVALTALDLVQLSTPAAIPSSLVPNASALSPAQLFKTSAAQTKPMAKEVLLSPLHLAVSIGDEGVVMLLLDVGVAVDEMSSMGTTCLHMAVATCQADLVQIILSYQPDLDLCTSKASHSDHCMHKCGGGG